MGVSFSAGTSPTVGKPSFELAADEMELGLGIHGEPGVTRTHLQSADQLTETLLTQILKQGKFGNGRRVVTMINNLGATTEMELAIVARHALAFLERNGFTVERIYAGTFLSSLDMAGISISVLGLQDGWLSLLDAPTSALAWPNVSKQRSTNRAAEVAPIVRSNLSIPTHPDVRTETGRLTKRAIEAACDALIAAESELTEMDRIVGDGDLGTSMKRAAAAVKDAVATYPLDDYAWARARRIFRATLRRAFSASRQCDGKLRSRGTAEVDRSTRGRLPRYQRAGRRETWRSYNDGRPVSLRHVAEKRRSKFLPSSTSRRC